MAILYCLLCLGIGYGIGSVLTAELVARSVTGRSVRQVGSGNPGAANVTEHMGRAAGAAVLAGDTLKTVAACLLCLTLAGDAVGADAAVQWAGLGAILGHDFPAWAGFRGGKGVTVTCVWLMLWLPGAGAECCALGGALVLLTGYLPLGAVVIPVLAVPAAFALHGMEGGLGALAAALLMLSRHYRGLVRIAHGRERRFFRRGGTGRH